MGEPKLQKPSGVLFYQLKNPQRQEATIAVFLICVSARFAQLPIQIIHSTQMSDDSKTMMSSFVTFFATVLWIFGLTTITKVLKRSQVKW